MSVAPSTRPVPDSGPVATVAGFLSAIAIFIGLIGIVYRPVRVEPAAILVALIAVGMGTRNRALGLTALAVTAAGFFLGMAVAVVTSHPLW